MAEPAKNLQPQQQPLTRIKLVNGIKVPWRIGSTQVQELAPDKNERLEEAPNFVWLIHTSGRRVGIPYANIKQAE
jgi:hypothetical protein